MDWIKIVIGAIFLTVWIANNIREMRKAAAAKAPPPAAPPEPSVDSPTRPADGLKDFLKDVRRRMGDPEPQPAENTGRDVLVEDPRQIEPPRWEATAAPKKSKKKRQAEPAPKVVRTAEVTSRSADFAKPAAMAPAPILGGSRGKTPSPVVGDVVNLLKSPAGLSTAFLLREILSEPMCKRAPGHRRKGL